MLSGIASAPWKGKILDALAANKSLPYAKYVQLATVKQDGRPANRTVVYRGFLDDSDDLAFITDRRSHKVSEVAANPAASVCWYFPTTREQYRLDGDLTIVDGDNPSPALREAREKVWSSLSDASRSQFTWPDPGLPRSSDPKAGYDLPPPSAEEPALPTFCLVILKVTYVDLVLLFENKRFTFTSAPAPDSTAGQSAASRAPQLVWEESAVNP